MFRTPIHMHPAEYAALMVNRPLSLRVFRNNFIYLLSLICTKKLFLLK